MIRTLLIALFLLIFFILSIPLFLVEWIIGKFNMDAKNRSSLAIVSWAFRVITFLAGVKATYIGLENVPTDTGVLYVANHRGFFDTILTYQKVPRPTGYISKKEIEKIPFLRVWMRNLQCLFLDRVNIKEGLKTILTAIDMLKNGTSICIFPEGTRNKGGRELLPFHEGSFKIAVKANAPIIPVTINNSSAVLEDSFPRIKSAKVIVEYGEPVYIDQLEPEQRKQLALYVQNIIQETYDKNQKLIEE